MIKLAQNKVLIVMLMLVAFIGQAMASTAMSFVSNTCAHESMSADMPMMDHADMMLMMSEKMEQSTEPGTMMDCCQEQCQCPMNGCVSISLLVDTGFTSLSLTIQKIAHWSLQHQSQINSSLYRPPIS